MVGGNCPTDKLKDTLEFGKNKNKWSFMTSQVAPRNRLFRPNAEMHWGVFYYLDASEKGEKENDNTNFKIGSRKSQISRND